MLPRIAINVEGLCVARALDKRVGVLNYSGAFRTEYPLEMNAQSC